MAPASFRLFGGVCVVLIVAGSLGAAAVRFAPDGAGRAAAERPAGEAAPVLRRAAYGGLASLDAAAPEPLTRSLAPLTRSIAPQSRPAAPVAYGALTAPPAPTDPGALRLQEAPGPRPDDADRPVVLDDSAPPTVVALAPVPRADAPLDGFVPPEVVPLPPSAPLRPSLLPVPLPPSRPPELKSLLPPGPPPKPDAVLAKTAPTVPDKPAATAVAPPLAPSIDRPVEPPAPSGPFAKGQAAYVRIFKQEGQLELWLKRGSRFALYKSFPICKWSGKLGPKVKEGDYQSPEGFYNVTARQLNPNSQYHLAFNVGYPNAYDRQHGRTGSALMVHGDCASVGCYAMTNKGIEEIYGYLEAALRNGQREVPVHIFPFRMTSSAIARNGGGGGLASLFGDGGGGANWGEFWRNLKEGYDLFERTGEPPAAYACNKRYAFGAAGAGCARIAGW